MKITKIDNKKIKIEEVVSREVDVKQVIQAKEDLLREKANLITDYDRRIATLQEQIDSAISAGIDLNLLDEYGNI